MSLRQIKSRIFGILFARDFEYPELQNSVVMLLWGLWMLALDPFNDLVKSFAAAALEREAPGIFWGWGFVVIGGASVWALIYQKARFRKALSMLSFVWWFYLFLMLVTKDPKVFPVPVSLVFALSSAWIHLRVSVHEQGEHYA